MCGFLYISYIYIYMYIPGTCSHYNIPESTAGDCSHRRWRPRSLLHSFHYRKLVGEQMTPCISVSGPMPSTSASMHWTHWNRTGAHPKQNGFRLSSQNQSQHKHHHLGVQRGPRDQDWKGLSLPPSLNYKMRYNITTGIVEGEERVLTRLDCLSLWWWTAVMAGGLYRTQTSARGQWILVRRS